ncbi:MAG: ribosome maturation factor RimP [Acidimicrobiia bacterium]|nr:ribosome maturation factor RimP [Acidimicrobiia bacterium]
MQVTGDAKTAWAMIEPWLAAEGLELDDVEMTGRTLRVLVDCEGGIGLDRLAEVSAGISRLIDDALEIEDSYQLEVSSPGLERKLKRPGHFLKSVGREVSVKARVDGETVKLRGLLEAADDTGFTVAQDSQNHRVAFDDVVTAKTVFAWEKAPKPGKK